MITIQSEPSSPNEINDAIRAYIIDEQIIKKDDYRAKFQNKLSNLFNLLTQIFKKNHYIW